MKNIIKLSYLIILVLLAYSCQRQNDVQWQDDFYHQPIVNRPALEVNYTDSARIAFQILAEQYHLTGQLRKPHSLFDDQGKDWLWMEMEDEQGVVYSTLHADVPSRINLYRRGPYFCEVRWMDVQLASEDGKLLPLKGDIGLFCYPEKILTEVHWHGTDAFNASKLHVRGISPHTFDCRPFSEGDRQSFVFPLFGEEDPLPDHAFTLLTGETPLRYDSRKGYYVVGTVTGGGFQGEFYETPNRYETAVFSLKNDDIPRKIYICHESVVGGGFVEGGMVLDQEGHPMPIVVQVSKNFAGEKEEPFYNPLDTAFSETFFPLYLEPYEEVTLSSLHLYQNWGRKMTKHWSSLGAWMDYFHSSTGMTETTCYVPFKFAGIGGVAIADFRAMSQETFWKGQPQHDNIAGHNFLSFFDGERWQHLKYESTIYRSTGPNWFDIQMNYISADGSIKVVADLWETPQDDELRSFFKVRYEVLKPITIHDAQANFRFLDITSRIQSLRYTRFAANGIDDLEIDFSKSPFPVRGHPLPMQNIYMAVYGDSVQERGSNGLVVRTFSAPGDIAPAASLQTGGYLNRFRLDGPKDTRLLLVPDRETLELKAGDVFEIDGFWLPYGERDNADTPRRELLRYGNNLPHVISCSRGTVVSDLPVVVKAANNRAEFSIKGGKDLVPVIVTGLTDWRYPRIWKKEDNRWRMLSHARNWEHDGYQMFVDEDGSFGAVFLVYTDHQEQHLRIRVGKDVKEPEKIKVTGNAEYGDSDQRLPKVRIHSPHDNSVVSLSFPLASAPAPKEQPIDWLNSEGSSWWFKSNEGTWERGGRINPNDTDIDLEYWWQNNVEGVKHLPPSFAIDLTGSAFEDTTGERTFVLVKDKWQNIHLEPGKPRAVAEAGAIAVQSDDKKQVLCMVWNRPDHVFSEGGTTIGVALTPIVFDLDRRYHVRGKIYLFEGSLEVLKDRISKETQLVLL